jgi:hypothetical protein
VISPEAPSPTDLTDERLEAIAKDIQTTHTNAVLHIAAQLAEARDIFRYRRDEGGFGGWVETRLRYSRSTAYNLLSIHERFGGEKDLSKCLDTFPASILYLLAAPSTPKAAIHEIIDRAQAGEAVPVAEVKRIIDNSKGGKPARTRNMNAQRADIQNQRSPVMSVNRATIYRRMKLGDETIDKLKGTSLASAREMDALVYLNRGAPEGEHTPIVKQLIADTVAGKDVSAITLRDDIGANSTAEAERLRVRIEELQAEKHRLEIKVAGLESEIEELRGKLKAGGDMSIGEFQAAIKKWEETVETQRGIIARLENENAHLRARVGPPPPDDGLDIPEFLQRAAP